MNKIFLLILSVLLISCATTYKDFKIKNVKDGEGVAIGVVNINYNGKPFNSNCSVCLNSINGPCQKLTEDGFVFINLKKGEQTFRRVVCKDGSQQHYNIEGATFNQSAEPTYFGQIDIEWTNNGGFKASELFGAIGAIISESKNDGQMKMAVSTGKMNSAIEAFKKQTNQDSLKVNKSMVRVGK